MRDLRVVAAMSVIASALAVGVLVATDDPGDAARSGFGTPATGADMVGFVWHLQRLSGGGEIRRLPSSRHLALWLYRDGEFGIDDGWNTRSGHYTAATGSLTLPQTATTAVGGFPLDPECRGLDVSSTLLCAVNDFVDGDPISASLVNGHLVLVADGYEAVFERVTVLTVP